MNFIQSNFQQTNKIIFAKFYQYLGTFENKTQGKKINFRETDDKTSSILSKRHSVGNKKILSQSI